MTLFPPTLEEQIAEVEREIEMRRRVYPLRVSEKKMGQRRADLQLERMESVLKTLRTVKRLKLE